jgi:hypothetical protein
MTPKEAIFEPHILITNKLNPVASESLKMGSGGCEAQTSTRRAVLIGNWKLDCRCAQEADSARPAKNHAGLAGIRVLGTQYGRIPEDLGRSASGCQAAKVDDWYL